MTPSGKVTRGCPNSARVNEKLRRQLSNAETTMLKLETTSPIVPGKEIKDTLRGYKKEDFFQFANKLMERDAERIAYTHLRKNQGLLNKFGQFVGKDELLIHEIDLNMIYAYERYLKGIGNKTNTIWGSMKYLKYVLRAAVLNDIIKESQNPFNVYKIRSEKTLRSYLTEQELLLLRDLELEPGSRLELCRDMFLFACYAGGIRISDLLFLQRTNYRDGRLTYRMKKTNTPVQNQPVGSIAKEIADKYVKRKTDSYRWLFPLMKLDDRPNNEKELHHQISSKTVIYNGGLKELTLRAGFDSIKLTSHLARHSFATLLLSKGQSIEVVCEILKHSNIRETQIYAKIINKQVYEAMAKL